METPPPKPVVKKPKPLLKKKAPPSAAEFLAAQETTLLSPPAAAAPPKETTLLSPPAVAATPQETTLLSPPAAAAAASPQETTLLSPPAEIVRGFMVKGYKYVGLRHGFQPIFMKITGDFDPDEPPEAGPGWPILIYEPVVVPDADNLHYYPQWVSGKLGWLMEKDMYNVLLFDETRDYYHTTVAEPTCINPYNETQIYRAQ